MDLALRCESIEVITMQRITECGHPHAGNPFTLAFTLPGGSVEIVDVDTLERVRDIITKFAPETVTMLCGRYENHGALLALVTGDETLH